MIRQSWNIDDSERRRILVLHENATKNLYLMEQKTASKSFPRTNLGDKFEFGKYESENVKKILTSLKPKIEDFMKTSDLSKFIVNIVAGESQVTNPPGFEEKGSLALARANSVKKYFEELFPELIKNGSLVINAPKDVSEVKIGKTPYNKANSQEFKQKYVKEYSQEQFVDFDITGEGIEASIPTGKKEFCSLPPFKALGSYLLADNDYTTVRTENLGGGEGELWITFETFSQPDIIYFEYNGKVYGGADFRGYSDDEYRIFIGTALMAKYGGGKLPAQFGQTTYQAISNGDQRLINSLEKMREWSLVKSFMNTFGPNSQLANSKYMEAFAEFDKDGKKKKFLKKLGTNFPWGILTSNIGTNIVSNLGPIPKVDGINTLKVINVCPVGTTQWKIYVNCKPGS